MEIRARLFPRQQALARWERHMKKNGHTDRPLLDKIGNILKTLSWNQARQVQQLSTSFTRSWEQIMSSHPRLGLAETMKRSAALYRATLSELAAIIVPKELSGKMAVGIFGSTARGELVPQSDCDFAFILGTQLTPAETEKLKTAQKQMNDVAFVFGLPLEGASGIIYPDWRSASLKSARQMQTNAALDLLFLSGAKSVYDQFQALRLKTIFTERGQHLKELFDKLAALPSDTADLKNAIRHISFLKHAASLHLQRKFGSTHDALVALRDEGSLSGREYSKLMEVLDRLLLLRLTLTRVDETSPAPGLIKQYLGGIATEKAAIRQAENNILLGLNGRTTTAEANDILGQIKQDVVFLKTLAGRLRPLMTAPGC